MATTRTLPDLGRLARRLRNLIVRKRLIHRVHSPISGEIAVHDAGRERTLSINGEAHSIGATRGSWREAEAECWGAIASPPFPLPDRPEVLMLGLGGGTALRLIVERRAPRAVTAVELDPAVVDIARRFFGLDELREVEVVVADARAAMEALRARGASFDLLVDDVYYHVTTAGAEPGRSVLGLMTGLVRPGGTIVFNRPVDDPAQIPAHERFAAELKAAGHRVETRSIRRRWWNDVIYCGVGSS